MRIASLGLRAYGPFTNVPIDLSAGEFGLHVIFGLNEAGKSSTLRALDAALFGIKGRTKDNFLHEYSALRLAVTLVNTGGHALSVVRRKATKNSLWNEDESDSVDDSALRPFIGALNSEEFHRVFGLDHVRLREGSDRLLDISEGVDAVIVGAALGLSDMRAVHKAIQAENDALFTPRASKPVINAAMAEWKRLGKQIKESGLSEGNWSSARLDAKRRAAAQTEAESHEGKIMARIAELEFGLRNRRRVVELTDLRSRLAQLGETPDLDDGFADRRDTARRKLNEAEILLTEHSTAEAALQGEVDTVKGDFAMLALESEVSELYELSIEVRKGLQDREKRNTEARVAEEKRDRIAEVLGLPTPLPPSTIADLRIASGSQERCEELLTEHTRLTTSQKEAKAALAALKSDLARVEDLPREDGNGQDPTTLLSAISDARRLGDMDERIREVHTEVGDQRRNFSEGIARLTGFTGEAEELSRLPVPGPASLEDFRTRSQALDAEDGDARRELKRIQDEQRQVHGTIEEISSNGKVPSLGDLGDVRARRDAQWDLVRRAWLDDADVDAAALELDPNAPLADALDGSISESDGIADRMRDESERVAKLSDAQLRLGQLSKELEAADTEAGNRQTRRQELEAARQDAWSESGFELGTPAIMKDQLAERDRLIAQRDALRGTESKLEDLEDRRTAARVSLKIAMAGIGVVARDEDHATDLAPLLRLADVHKETLAEEAEERRGAKKKIKRLQSEIGDAEDAQIARAKELEEWHGAFALATQGLPVRNDDPPQEIRRILRQVTSILDEDSTSSGLRDRIEKIDRDATDLSSRLTAFFAAHLPNTGGEDREPSVHVLKALVEEEKLQNAAFEDASERLEKIQTKQKQAVTAVDLALRTLSDLAQDAGSSKPEELPALIRRADEKRECRGKLDTLEDDLRSEGYPIDETEARIAKLEGVEIDVELEPLQESLEEVHAAAVSARDQAREAQSVFDAMGGDSQAAESAAEAAEVASGIREDAERYVRGVLGSHLLRSAVERFRDRNEAPMLKLASKYFAGLTLGRYTRVETDVDSKGKSFFLVRESNDSASKTMDTLSDGTRDQLHLALVLGSLEHRFASGGAPIPLVLDDVLVHFDDKRSAAAMEVLAEFSKTSQVLLFTHHTRIKELAEGMGKAKGAFVHHLDSKSEG